MTSRSDVNNLHKRTILNSFAEFDHKRKKPGNDEFLNSKKEVRLSAAANVKDASSDVFKILFKAPRNFHAMPKIPLGGNVKADGMLHMRGFGSASGASDEAMDTTADPDPFSPEEIARKQWCDMTRAYGNLVNMMGKIPMGSTIRNERGELASLQDVLERKRKEPKNPSPELQISPNNEKLMHFRRRHEAIKKEAETVLTLMTLRNDEVRKAIESMKAEIDELKAENLKRRANRASEMK